MAFFICYANVLTRFMYSVLPVRSCLFYEEQYENREHCDHMRKQGGGEVFTAVGKCLPTLFLLISIRMTGNPPDRIFIQMNELSLPGSKRSLFFSAEIQSFLF